MKVLLIGATGATGTFVLSNLLNDEQVNEVVVFVRKSTGIKNAKLTEIITTFDQLADYQSYMHAQVAISCLGSTLKQAGSKQAQWVIDYEYQLQFAQLATQNQVPHFILLSSLGASAKSKVFYSKMKGALEDAVIKLPFTRLDILQPSLLIRPKSDRLGEKVSEKLLQFLNVFKLMKSYQPIKVENLGLLIKQLVFEKQSGVFVWTLIDLINKLQKK